MSGLHLTLRYGHKKCGIKQAKGETRKKEILLCMLARLARAPDGGTIDPAEARVNDHTRDVGHKLQEVQVRVLTPIFHTWHLFISYTDSDLQHVNAFQDNQY